MHRLLLAAALGLMAAAPASYDAVCPAPCIASDGTTQPAGTALFRFQWDGQAAYTPTDSAGAPLAARLSVSPPGPLYQPAMPPAVPLPQDVLTVAPSGSIAIRHPDGTISDSGLVVPTPLAAIPPAPTPAGIAGTAKTYVPADAAAPSLTRSTTATTASDGTFSVTWAIPLVSAAPVVMLIPLNTASQPAICDPTAVSAMGVSGKCWTTQTATLTLAAVTAGTTVNPTGSVAAGMRVFVFSREPTQ